MLFKNIFDKSYQFRFIDERKKKFEKCQWRKKNRTDRIKRRKTEEKSWLLLREFTASMITLLCLCRCCSLTLILLILNIIWIHTHIYICLQSYIILSQKLIRYYGWGWEWVSIWIYNIYIPIHNEIYIKCSIPLVLSKSSSCTYVLSVCCDMDI